MRRPPLTLHQAIAAAIPCCGLLALGCGLDLDGLQVADDASPPSSVSTVSSTLDGAIALLADGSGSSASSSPPTDPAPADAAVDAASPPPPPTSEDADVPDVVLDPDASSSATGDPCDKDEDGFRSSSAECGGTDCCDIDARTFPGESSFFTSADACGSFDYNCNGKDDLELGTVNCTLGLLSCGGSGFDGAPPGCGDTATFDTCDFFVLCYTSQSQKVEACR